MIDARNTRKTGKNRSRRRDERENAQILWSVVAFCMAIGVAITGFSLWISYRDGYYINSVMKDLLLVFAIVAEVVASTFTSFLLNSSL